MLQYLMIKPGPITMVSQVRLRLVAMTKLHAMDAMDAVDAASEKGFVNCW